MAADVAHFGVLNPSASAKAVLFDFDGTLWDPDPYIFQSYDELFREYRCVLPSSLWSSLVGTTGFDLLTYLEKCAGIPVNRVYATDYIQQRLAVLLSTVTIRSGVHSLLSAIDAAGLTRGIVSNSPRSWVDHYLAQCAIINGWRTIRTADGDLRVAKPSPYLYECALADLGVDATEALAFEDSLSGVHAAIAAGIRCIAVPGHMSSSLDFSAANLCFDSYEDIDLWSLLHAQPDSGSSPPRFGSYPKGRQ